jgi:hypothetical protein
MYIYTFTCTHTTPNKLKPYPMIHLSTLYRTKRKKRERRKGKKEEKEREKRAREMGRKEKIREEGRERGSGTCVSVCV